MIVHMTGCIFLHFQYILNHDVLNMQKYAIPLFFAYFVLHIPGYYLHLTLVCISLYAPRLRAIMIPGPESCLLLGIPSTF